MSLLRNIRRQTRLTMEATLPPAIMSRVSLLYPPSLFLPRLKSRQREKRYRQLTEGLPPDTVIFDERYNVRATEEALDSYLHFCWMDERMVIEMANFLRLTAGKSCLYDVGALHGVFSFVFCTSTGGASLAFEPSPPAAGVLNKVGALNPDLRVTHFPFALGSNPGELTMRMDWQHLIAVPDAAANDGNMHRVRVETVDRMALEHLKPDCMKVDVEGFEHEVLLGAKETLARSKPLLFLEIHTVQLAENGTSVQAVLDLLKDLKYEILSADLRPFRLSRDQKEPANIFNLICR